MADEPHMTVEWVDGGREPQCPPNPDFPYGIDVDVSAGAKRVCMAGLPYPAKRIGHYVVTCSRCKKRIVVTTAGRPDDPRSITVGCGGAA